MGPDRAAGKSPRRSCSTLGLRGAHLCCPSPGFSPHSRVCGGNAISPPTPKLFTPAWRWGLVTTHCHQPAHIALSCPRLSSLPWPPQPRTPRCPRGAQLYPGFAAQPRGAGWHGWLLACMWGGERRGGLQEPGCLCPFVLSYWVSAGAALGLLGAGEGGIFLGKGGMLAAAGRMGPGLT